MRRGTGDFYFKGARFSSKKDMISGLKESINEMNDRWYSGEKVAYCFYLTPKGLVFFPRKYQGDENYFNLIKNSRLTTGFAFYEMLGDILCPDIEYARNTDSEKINKETKEIFNLLSLNI